MLMLPALFQQVCALLALLRATVCSAVAAAPQLVFLAIQEVLCFQQALLVSSAAVAVLPAVLELQHHARLALLDLL